MVPDRAEPSEAALDALAEKLAVLANPARLRLLRVLQEPTSVGEVRLAPSRGAEEERERAMSRQAVREHLDRLIEAGLVDRLPPHRAGGRADEYVVDHARLFALTEEVRALNAVRAIASGLKETLGAPPDAAPPAPSGPHLLLVHGRGEGRAFALAPATQAPERGWVVGRRAGVAVRLDYDAFVSSENTEVLRDADGAFRVLDLRTSRNGTRLNFMKLDRGGEAPLRTGDVLGVGRSLLVFRAG